MRASLLILVSLFFSSCSSTGGGTGADGGPAEGSTYYTLTNLHPDPAKQTLSSLNYQQGGLIPVGSEVAVDSRSGKRMKFTDAKTGVQYTWTRSKHIKSSLAETLTQYFGSQAQIPDVASFSEADAEGIRTGKPAVGMTKAGILVALGPPPSHATPSLDLPNWTYWKNRWARQVLTFSADGVVTSIDG